MNLFDILGPVMVGPSSSHTAGAVRIGRVARRLLGSQPVRAEIGLSGSFAATGRGHGTDRAILAGLMDMEPSDERIAASLELAREAGIDYRFTRVTLPGAHPNTARLTLTAADGKQLTMTASSLGGGRILVNELNGLEASFSGDLPTLIVRNIDQPGHVSDVATMLSHKGVNVASMRVYRDHPGGNAVMIIETDKAVPEDGLRWLARSEGIVDVTFIDRKKEADEDGV